MKNRILKYLTVGLFSIFSSCDYLDVVPDNIATIDNAFVSRSMAEKYLFTCYSFMPAHASLSAQSFLIADEFWSVYPQNIMYFNNIPFEQLARNNQSIVDPCLNYWNGLVGGKPMFQALRDCNIFLERMYNGIPGMPEFEQNRWIAEVKFLKAYYHYWLLRMYGPIPLIKENIPVSAGVEEVQVVREPVDDCFDYIVSLLDEAVPDLPLTLDMEATELGRATQPIALALKAKVLVEAASPLFNGNSDYTTFRRKTDGVQYFNMTYESSKWEKAAIACRNAIDTCHLAGFTLYNYQPGAAENLPPEMITQMSIRNSVAEGNNTINTEVIWYNPNSSANDLQTQATPRLDPQFVNNFGVRSILAPPLKIAEMFYTSNGVPMDEDREWETDGLYGDRYSVRTATEDDRYNIREGYQTATMNFNRETRFYANLSFDGNLWYGNGATDPENQWLIRAKFGEYAGKINMMLFSVSGYFCKKFVNYRNVIRTPGDAGYTVTVYSWPVLRLADLYLLCSEALNEAYGPSQEAYQWIDLVRERAGLEGVEASWSKYARTAYQAKPTTQDGFRDIIQRERLIELANEGLRYWEIRRWKKAKEMWHNQPIQGWDVDQNETATYYRIRTLYTPQFTTKDYFWPIREYDLTVNPNLDQNPGW